MPRRRKADACRGFIDAESDEVNLLPLCPDGSAERFICESSAAPFGCGGSFLCCDWSGANRQATAPPLSQKCARGVFHASGFWSAALPSCACGLLPRCGLNVRCNHRRLCCGFSTALSAVVAANTLGWTEALENARALCIAAGFAPNRACMARRDAGAPFFLSKRLCPRRRRRFFVPFAEKRRSRTRMRGAGASLLLAGELR